MQKFVLPLVLLLGCGPSDEGEREIPDGAALIAIGDSLLEWHIDAEASIPEVVGQELGVDEFFLGCSSCRYTL